MGKNNKLVDELVYKILNETIPNFYDNPNGPYEFSCPFCEDIITIGGNVEHPKIEDFNHSDDCIYTIAKKLYT
jgi:hypothetical protein